MAHACLSSKWSRIPVCILALSEQSLAILVFGYEQAFPESGADPQYVERAKVDAATCVRMPVKLTAVTPLVHGTREMRLVACSCVRGRQGVLGRVATVMRRPWRCSFFQPACMTGLSRAADGSMFGHSSASLQSPLLSLSQQLVFRPK